MSFMRRCFAKGSFTIEAVIWVPLLSCLLLAVLREGIASYEKSMNRESPEEISCWDGVSRFYELWALKELEVDMEDE